MNAGQPNEARPTTQPTTTNNESSTDDGDLAQRCAEVHKLVYDFLERKHEDDGSDSGDEIRRKGRIRQAQAQTRTSLGIIEEALGRFSLDSLSLSYNGGKDCLVLLLLYLAALHTYSMKTSTPLPRQLPSVYIITPNPFPDVTRFVLSSSAHYALHLTSYTLPMRQAFTSYLDSHPAVQAIFVGTRRTDPHGKELGHFDETDRGWPKFMRVHPVIDWHYADIWTFVKELGVEYCGLYDEGYTSLGGVGDTKRNPALRVEGEEEVYRPAYELLEDGEERLGRE